MNLIIKKLSGIYNILKFKFHKIKVGKGLRVLGSIGLDVKGKLIIGDNFRCISGGMLNPMGRNVKSFIKVSKNATNATKTPCKTLKKNNLFRLTVFDINAEHCMKTESDENPIAKPRSAIFDIKGSVTLDAMIAQPELISIIGSIRIFKALPLKGSVISELTP